MSRRCVRFVQYCRYRLYRIATPPSRTPCKASSIPSTCCRYCNCRWENYFGISRASGVTMSREHDGRRLPPGWVKGESSRYKKTYFFNTQTGESFWFPPEMSPAAVVTSSTGEHKRRNPALEGHERDAASLPAAKRSRKQPQPLPPTSTDADHDKDDDREYSAAADDTNGVVRSAPDGPGLRVAVIVPYRDLDPAQRRAAHLTSFVPYMEEYLGRHVRLQSGDFRVYIVEQSKDDGCKFNRGKLLNIGFDLARAEGCNAFVFHDVDLLPSDELGRWYASLPEQPVHIARVWKQYSNNPKYFGGVVSFSREDFEKINGFPNTFWGWGGEDDEMYSRIMEVDLKPQKAEDGEFTDLEGLDLQTKLGLLRRNEHWKCQVKKEALEEHAETWERNGLADLKYGVLGREALAQNTEKVTVDVELNGHWTDTITHWRDLDKRYQQT